MLLLLLYHLYCYGVVMIVNLLIIKSEYIIIMRNITFLLSLQIIKDDEDGKDLEI